MKLIDEDTKKVLLQRDFFYEVKIMKKCFSLLSSYDSIYFEPVLESFLVHIRNLYEFFYQDGNGDKSHAQHFIKEWVKVPDKKIKDFYIKINHYLSHLSYNRVIKIYEPWNIKRIYTHFKLLIKEFLKILPDKYLNKELKQLIW